MPAPSPRTLRNAEAAALADVPRLELEDFRQVLSSFVDTGARIAALFGLPSEAGKIRIVAALAQGEVGALSVLSTEVGEAYPSLTTSCPQAHWFEREIAEQWGVRPVGHPWLKPIRFHPSWRPPRDAWKRADEEIQPGVTEFFRVEGDEVHEVAVGPVHAGVIEPGHFRFQCHGEEVIHLEISLGYQHRGIEKALLGGPGKRAIHWMETLAGDTSCGHAAAYCEAVEGLAGCEVSPRAQALRGVALELERCANHTGDLGALANDVGYLPTASFCGRLRGDFLNLTALLCGSRVGRGMVRPGGVGFNVDDARVADLLERLDRTARDTKEAAELLWQAPSVMARFEGTGTVSRQTCLELGLVGLVARASGLDRDVRQEFPTGIYRFAQLPISTWSSGDVFARAYVRWLEIDASVRFVRDQLRALPTGPVRSPVGALPPGKLVATLVEGWRGEICHVAVTDDRGRFARYKVVDPSFHNWAGLQIALRNQQISDFPLCNKSFNLSYCGHDL